MPKAVSKYNPTDIYKFWVQTFRAKKGRTYSPAISAMYDTKRFKELLEDHSVFVILNSIKAALGNGCDNPRFFAESFEDYIPGTSEHMLYFYVNEFGGEEQRVLWREYRMLDTSWVVDARTTVRKNEIKSILNEWVEDFEL